MASISANGSKGNHKFTLTVNETGTDTSKNTSTVSFSFVLSSIQTGWNWSGYSSKISYTVKINGTSYTGTISSYDGKSSVTLKSGTQTISHSADGSKSISYSFSVTDTSTVNYTCGNASKSETLALTTIPRGAKLVTAPDFNDEGNPKITYSNPAGNAVTSIEAAIYNTAGGSSYAPYRSISKTGSSYTFNLTDTERNNLRKAATGNTLEVRFYVRSVLGGKTYISYSERRTLTIVNANPVVTGTVYDVNEDTIGLTGNREKLVKYHSNALATMTAEAKKYAAIDEGLYIIRNGSNTGYGKSFTFEGVESNTFTFSAEDSRRNIGTDTVTKDMVDYVKLTCNIANYRPDAVGNMTVLCMGNYFNDTFGAVANTLKTQYRYGITGSAFSEWADMEVSLTGNSYFASANFTIPDFDKSKYYSFQTRAIDKLEEIESVEYSVNCIPQFHWNESSFTFEVPVTFKSGAENALGDGDQQITGNLRLKGDKDYGNALYFGDGSFCYLSEPSDDVLVIYARKSISLNSSNVFVNGYAIPILDSGTWTPTLNSSAISSYSTQSGWYSRSGQNITVGFFIKATCKSGYDTTNISIGGLPFTPKYSAAGGGMCAGAYVSAGMNFQCFVAGTDGLITTRVQSCNNTAAANISTSASGCKYRSGGGEITLSGTITFTANS